MGLLQTYGKYSTYIDANGFYRVIWQFDDGNITMHKFDTVKTEKELALFFANFEDWGGAVKLQTELDDNEELMKETVVYIRNHPALTLTQWNAVLATKQWYEQVIIRAFLYKLTLLLAEHYGVVLDDYTEAQILLKLRNWICNTEIRTLKRVVFGYNLTL